ncbi:hypothetical protein BCR44DRAFT_1282181 [Catenaria anguillulae PL171]|uniref:Uncharacterized protein n=1 Tax=Catenaria anguillulae PL171 TaxID=765915 RepID=A0A1Y2HW48_9FUNG|nr:hypothetical protein BCR44DRAFT_1282181 [Catenaria anguillulae PL171]
MDDYYNRINNLSLDLLARQRNLLDTFTIEQSFIQSAYERDVRLGASIKASEIFLELSTIGSELSELKKARRVEEKLIRARVREEYEELVAELSSQIHKLKARFTEFRINSVDEVLSALSEVKRDDLLAFIGKDYHANAATTGNTIISLQETIDEIRSDNAELKQVMSKLKSMYALKSMTSKSVFTKKITRLVEEKRVAEERLWESYRESEVRERVLRKNLVKTQKELVSIQTHHEVLKRQLKEEQRAKELLQKALSMHVSENKASMEMASLRKVETFTRFEFERLLEENKKLNDECSSLRLEVARLQTVLQAQEWRLATKQRLRMSPSRPSSPSARPLHSAAASRTMGASNPDILQSAQNSVFSQPQSPEQFLLRPTSALPAPMAVDRGLQHQALTEVSPAHSSKARPSTARRQLTPSTVFHAKSTSSSDLIREEITLQMRDPVSPRRPMTAKRERILTMPHIGSGSRPGSGIVSRSPSNKQ